MIGRTVTRDQQIVQTHDHPRFKGTQYKEEEKVLLKIPDSSSYIPIQNLNIFIFEGCLLFIILKIFNSHSSEQKVSIFSHLLRFGKRQ